MTTDFTHKAKILAEFWISKQDEQPYKEFIAYNDLGLPLAFAYDEGMVEIGPQAKNLITETFESLLEVIGIPDSGFTHLNQLLGSEQSGEG